MKGQIESNIISEGINNSLIGDYLKGIMVIGIGLGLVFVLVLGFGFLTSLLNPNPQIVGQQEIKCNYPMLQCSISDHTKLLGGEVKCPNGINEPCYRESNYFPILDNKYNICGWQEANAYFEYYKLNTPLLDNSNLSITCTE